MAVGMKPLSGSPYDPTNLITHVWIRHWSFLHDTMEWAQRDESLGFLPEVRSPQLEFGHQ